MLRNSKRINLWRIGRACSLIGILFLLASCKSGDNATSDSGGAALQSVKNDNTAVADDSMTQAGSTTSVDGGKGFKKHCAGCHPNGGDIINPKKPLDKKSLAADNIKSAKDIIDKMRNPGPGMTKFDEKTISDKEANAIAMYILKTF